MKCVIKRLLAAVLAVSFLLGFFTAATSVSRVSSSDSDTRVRVAFEQFYKQKRNSVDVVLIGSSAIYREYIAIENWDDFGFTSYVLGTMGMPFSASEYLIREAEKTQSPSLYVIEIRQLVNDIVREKASKEKDKSTLDSCSRFLASCMPFSYNRYLLIKNLLPGDVFYSYFDFIRDHLKWCIVPTDKFCKNFFRNSSYETYINTKCANTAVGCEPFETHKYQTDEAYELPEDILAEIDSLLSYIKKENVNVLFLSTPYYQSESQKISENSVKKYLASNGFNYINCNNYYDEIGIDFSSDFYDNRHTNILGALKVTEFIGEYINKNYQLKKIYSQKIKDNWNESFSVWEKERKEDCEIAKSNAEEAKNEINN